MNTSLGVAIEATKATAKEGEVIGRLRRAENSAEALIHILEHLEKCLSPVLRPAGPSIPPPSVLASVDGSSPLAQQIDSLADRLKQCIDMANSVQNRLEV